MTRHELRRRQYVATLAGAVVASAVPGSAVGQSADASWRTSRGDPTNAGFLADSDAPVDGVSLAGRTSVGTRGPPAVVDGTVYFTTDGYVPWGYDGEDDGIGDVRARSVDGGEPAWTRSFDADVVTPPAVVGNSVYVVDRDGVARSLDADTGETEWSVDARVGQPEAPVVADGTVYLSGEAGTASVVLTALDVADGAERWRKTRDGLSRAPPAVHDGTVFAQGGPFAAYEAESGEEVWTNTEIDTGDFPPVLAGGRLFVVGNVAYPSNVLQAVDPADGTVEWRVEPDADVLSDPVADGSGVYLSLLDGTVVRYDAATGDRSWSADTVGYARGSLAGTAGAIYATCDQEYCYAFDPDTGDRLWRVRLRERPSIAVGSEHLFLGSRAGLTRLAAGSETDLAADRADHVSADWRVRTGYEPVSGPVADDERLYFVRDHRTMVSYAFDGEDEWRTELHRGNSFASSPGLADDRVLVRSEGHGLLGFDGSSGQHEWTVDLAGSPGVAPRVGDELAFVAAGETLVGVDPQSGEQRWELSMGATIDALSPVVGNAVFVLTGRLIRKVSAAGEDEWPYMPESLETVQSLGASSSGIFAGGHDGVEAFGAEAGDELWTADRPDPVFAGVAATDDVVYGGDIGGTVFALDASDGTERWTVPTDGDVRAPGVLVDDLFVVGNEAERVHFIEASSGNTVARYDATGPISTAPIPGDGRVFVLDELGTLHAVTVPNSESVAGSTTTGDTGPGFTGLAGVAGLLGAGAWLERRRDE